MSIIHKDMKRRNMTRLNFFSYFSQRHIKEEEKLGVKRNIIFFYDFLKLVENEKEGLNEHICPFLAQRG